MRSQVVLAHIQERLAGTVARVVHHDVEIAERGDAARHRRFRATRRRKVLHDHVRIAAGARDLGRSGFVDVDQCECAAARGEGESRGATKPAAGAGDHGEMHLASLVADARFGQHRIRALSLRVHTGRRCRPAP